MATIGTIQASDRPLTPVQGAVPGALIGLAQIGRAGNNLATALADKAQTDILVGDTNMTTNLAHRQRQQNLESAAAMVEFSKLQGEWARETVDIEKNAAANGSDYMTTAQTALDEKLNGFTAKLPEHLRNSFLPQVENFKQSELNSAYGKQLGMEGKAYVVGLNDLTTQMLNSINSGQSHTDYWLPQIDAYLSHTPLPKAETEALRKATLKSLQSMEFLKSTEAELQNPGAVSTGPNAAPSGMPARGMALLSAITGVESAGGDFSLMYTPPGTAPRHFTDFSQHPNSPAVIPSGPNAGKSSTAAGAGMFIKGTWDYIAEKYNLPDFSPTNQMKGMWYLAQEDYQKRTGRNLEADISSNDPIILSAVRKGLVGTWEGLGNMSDEEFVAKMQSGKSTLPSTMDDPTFTELGPDERMALLNKAQTNVGEQQRADLAAHTAQMKATVNSLSEQVASGALATTAEINAAAEQAGLDFTEKAKLLTIQGQYNKDQVKLEEFLKAAATPGHVSTEADKEGFGIYYQRTAGAKVAAMDQNVMNTEIFPAIGATGIVPQPMVNDLLSMAQSGNPAKAEYAYSNMDVIRQMDPGLFGRTFTEQQQSDILYYNTMAPYMSAGDRLAELKLQNSPEFAAVRSQRKQEVSQLVSQSPATFSLPTIVDGLGATVDMLDAGQGAALQGAYLEIFSNQYAKTGDTAAAQEATNKLMSTRWGVFDVGGIPSMMENPPQLAGVPPINGDWKWLDQSLRMQLAPTHANGGVELLSPDKPYKLGADAQTEQEKNQGQPPSYTILVDQGNGIPLPLLGADNMPIRLNFDEPQTQKKIALDGSLWMRKSDAVLNMRESLAMEQPIMPDEQYNELQGLFSAIQLQLDQEQPKVGAGTRVKTLDSLSAPVLTEEEQKVALAKLGYTSMDKFIHDLPMMDYSTIKEMLQGN